MLKRDINASLADLAQLLGMTKTELGMIRGPISKSAKKAAEKLKAGEKSIGGPPSGPLPSSRHLSARFTPFSFPWLIEYHHPSTTLNGPVLPIYRQHVALAVIIWGVSDILPVVCHPLTETGELLPVHLRTPLFTPHSRLSRRW